MDRNFMPLEQPEKRDEISPFHKVKQQVQKQLSRLLKRLRRRKEDLYETLQDCLNWNSIRHEGDLLKANFNLIKPGMTQIKVWDWLEEKEKALSLNPKRQPQDELAQRYKRSKKLQAGIPYMEKQLDKLERQLEEAQLDWEALQKVETEQELSPFKQKYPLPSLPTSKVKEEKVALPPYLEFQSAKGVKIWVGRNAKCNETLTFNLAKGLDWWLHVHGFPGSHVVIRTAKGEEPDAETFSDAVQLALYYSKARPQGEGEICLTQRKYVSRFGKGQTGKVQISKHKLIFARLDVKHYERIKNRREKND